MAKCRSCRTPIEWAITENGKRMPIDRMPSRDGNLIKTGNRISGCDEVHAIGRFDEIPERTARYTSHFATCPEAARQRR